MRSRKMRRQIGIFVILSILLCEMCFNEQPFKTYSSCASESGITSSVQIHITRVKRIIGGERVRARSNTGEVLRRTGRRLIHSLNRRMSAGLSFVDFLPRMFHSTIFLQNNEISHNTSGHIALIRSIYRKDGKKREIA